MQYIAGHSKLIVTVLFTSILSVALGSEQSANVLLNGGAEDGKDQMPSLWFNACIPAQGLTMYRDSKVVHSGKYSLMIANTHEYDEVVCNNWTQDLQQIAVGTVINVSAYVKAQDADSVNLCIQCWGLDQGSNMLAFTSTNVLRGDTDWVLLESSPVQIPARTAKVTVRAVLTGSGKVWFDDVKINTIEMSDEIKQQMVSTTRGQQKYTQDQVRQKEAVFFFDRIGDQEPGYHHFSALWAIIEKASLSDDQVKKQITEKACEIMNDPNQTPFRRWQCCYVVSGTRDTKGIPSLEQVLLHDKNITVRGCAACALGAFSEKQAIEALKQAQTTEQNPEVLSWIEKALNEQFRKK